MKRVCLLYPYFGRLKNYFELWFESAKRNPQIDFYIIGDVSLGDLRADNVFLITMSFQEVKARIESFLGYSVKLKKPYKLCDYKPLYCYLFSDIVAGYRFWGFGDLDVILGDLSPVVEAIDSDTYDAFFECGHLEICRNIPSINNSLFDLVPPKALRAVAQSNKIYGIDEFQYARVNAVLASRAYVDKGLIADICVGAPDLQLYSNSYDHLVFEYHRGKLLGWYLEDGLVKKKEFLYCHLQKRHMDLFVNDRSRFVLNSSCFADAPKVIDVDFLLNFGAKNANLDKKYRRKYYRYLVKRIVLRAIGLKPQSFQKTLFKKRPPLK